MHKLTLLFFIFLSSVAFSQVATDLPGWVTSIPKTNNKKVYALGISDPKMEEKEAYRLAILRAKTMLALFHSSNIKQVIDLYESQKEQGAEMNAQKLEKLSKIYSKYIVDSAQIEVVKRTYTVDQEAIVLIKETIPKLDTAKFKDTIIVESNTFMQEFKIDEASKSVKNFIIGALEIDGKNKDTLKFYYECADENNIDFTINATFMDTVFTTFNTMHEYKSTTNTEVNGTEFLGYSNLKKGLWKAYFDAVLQNMIAITNIMSTKTKNAGDAYKNDGTTDYTSKDEHLYRNISSNTLSVALRDIAISKNIFWVKMAAVSFDKTEFQQKTERVLGILKKPLEKLK